jgi:hypothetical protein
MEPFAEEYLRHLERTNNWLFGKLLEYKNGGESHGRIEVSFFFNAYQPRSNRIYREFRPRAQPPDNPFFKQYSEEIAGYGAKRQDCDSLLKVAVTDCYVPLFAAAKFFPISIAFPQTTLDGLKRHYPEVYAKAIEQHNHGELDLGISSYHHAFAPMLRADLLEQEYLSALAEFLKMDKKRDDFIALHIPECAVSPTLLEVLGKIQSRENVRFATVLDSEYHNAAPYSYDIGKPNKINYLAKGEICRLRALFSNNFFSRTAFSFPPSGLDEKGTAFWYLTTLFESIAKPQAYPYWDRLCKGENVNFVVHTDAETIGFHAPGREYALFLFLHLLNSFNFKLSTISKCAKKDPPELHVTKERVPLLFRTWDMETHGDIARWMKRGDPNSSAQFLFHTLEIYPPIIRDLEEAESGMGLGEKRRLWAARMRFANSLTSCPHWWHDPDSVPGKQFVKDILKCGEHLGKLCKRVKHVSKSRNHLLKEAEELRFHPFVQRTGIKMETRKANRIVFS